MDQVYRVVVDPLIPRWIPLKGFRRLLAKFGFPVRREIVFGVTNDFQVRCHPAVLEEVKQHLRQRGIKYTLDKSCLAEVPEVEP